MSGLMERVAELRESGKNHLAENLLKGAWQSASVDDIEIRDDVVRVTRGCFEGVHKRTTNREGQPIVKQAGRYHVRDDDFDFEFTTRSLTAETQEAIHARLRSNEDQTPPESEVVTDGGTSWMGFLRGKST